MLPSRAHKWLCGHDYYLPISRMFFYHFKQKLTTHWFPISLSLTFNYGNRRMHYFKEWYRSPKIPFGGYPGYWLTCRQAYTHKGTLGLLIGIGDFFHWLGNISDKSSLREEVFFQLTIPGATAHHGCASLRQLAILHLHSGKESDERWCSGHFLLFTQFRIPDHEIVPPTSKVAVPTSTNLM